MTLRTRTYAIIGCLALSQSLGCASAPWSRTSSAPASGKSGGFLSNLFGGSKSEAAATPAAYQPPAPKQTLTDNSVTRAVGSVFASKPDTTTPYDSISLANETAPPGPDFYVTVARLQERNGAFDGAVDQYQRALQLNPKHLPARVGLARLHDRMNNLPEATKHYQQAALENPGDADLLNDLALCHARKGDLAEATRLLRQAVDISPRETRYRNNLATVLVETGAADAALAEQTAVHAPAVAHYNVGFLLAQRGHNAQAVEQFRRSVELDPSSQSAQQWLDHLTAAQTPAPPQAGVPAQSNAAPQASALPQAAAPQTIPPQAVVQPTLPPREVHAVAPQVQAPARNVAPAGLSEQQLRELYAPKNGSSSTGWLQVSPSSAAVAQPAAQPQAVPQAATPAPVSAHPSTPAPPATKPVQPANPQRPYNPAPGIPPTPDDVELFSGQAAGASRAIPATAIQPLPPVNGQRLPSRY